MNNSGLYHNEPIWCGNTIVGDTTSGMYGHTIGSCLGMDFSDHPIRLTIQFGEYPICCPIGAIHLQVHVLSTEHGENGQAKAIDFQYQVLPTGVAGRQVGWPADSGQFVDVLIESPLFPYMITQGHGVHPAGPDLL